MKFILEGIKGVGMSRTGMILAKVKKNIHEEFTNKLWELEVTKKMWDECPECKSRMNFIKITSSCSIGSRIEIKCNECGFRKDITPYYLW